MKTPRSYPNVRSNVFVLVGATLVALAAAELLARTIGVPQRFGPQIFVRDVPTRLVEGIPLWRDEHPRYDPDDVRRAANEPDAFTIVGLGDSIMYGVGLAKEDTYLENVRRALTRGSSRRVEILNLAVPGYNTAQENAVYEEIADQIRPDLVIVHYWTDDTHQYRVVGGYVVDLGNVSEHDGYLVVRALPVPPPLGDFLFVHSRLYDVLTQAVVALRSDLRSSNDWQGVTTPLAEIQRRARQSGAHLLVLASPSMTGPTPRATDDLAALEAFATGNGIELIDLATWVAGVDSKEIAVDSCHFNAKGHRIIGERLADYVLRHDWNGRARQVTVPARPSGPSGETRNP